VVGSNARIDALSGDFLGWFWEWYADAQCDHLLFFIAVISRFFLTQPHHVRVELGIPATAR
jgi:hypothetical protein